MTTLKTLGEELPKELARVRELLSAYKEIGTAGRFGALMIEGLLRKADKAMADGDVVNMIRVYEELKNTQ